MKKTVIFKKDSCYSLVSKIVENHAHISVENNKLKAKEKDLSLGNFN